MPAKGAAATDLESVRRGDQNRGSASKYRGPNDEEIQFRKHNYQVDWGTFESDAYWKHNYQELRADDKEIIETVADFFSARFERPDATSGTRRGLDVGSGANLYPALSMLPWCSEITLTDVGPQNLAWLVREAGGTGTGQDRWDWQDFWDVYATRPGYRDLSDPRTALQERHEVRELSVMELPQHRWDLGTMFFVAESMTNYETEFEDAVDRFMLALKPDAPFAAAFMDGSEGYVVADQSFPAVREVDTGLVQYVLKDYSDDVEVKPIQVPALDPLRDGYKGMIIATGTARRRS